MTLIRSNPSYKAERADYLYQKYNFKGKTLEEVTDIFRKVDLMGNAINEQTGGQIPVEEMYLWVVGWINDGDARIITRINNQQLYLEMEELFLSYPPVLYEETTLETLDNIRQETPASTFSILSNTAFIKGSTLRKVLPGLGLGDIFDFQLFSDEAGISKPNLAFFQQMLVEVHKLRGRLDPGDIVHIGDNPIADVEGASRAGIAQVLVNSNQLSIASLCNKP
jgi:putative hydrolase of the HAD superfamily